MSVTHAKVSGKPNPADATLVGGEDWDSAHVVNLTAADVGAAEAAHTHEAFPVGSVFIGVVSTNPATLLGYGTWAAFGAGRVLIGNDGATYGTDEATGGAETKAISAHSGATVGDHAALTHTGTAVGNHASHTHTYTDVVNHVHVQSVNSGTTGALSGYGVDTSTSTSVSSGYSTANPTGGVATGTTAGPNATLTHSVTDPSQHAAQAHTVGQASAHTDLNVVQPYIVVHMWKRTA